MQLARCVVSWTGPAVVGLAVNVLHFDASNSDPDPAAIRSAYAVAAGLWSPDHAIQVPSSGDVIDDATGNLVRVWSGTPVSSVTGTSTGNYAAGVGAVINWLTGQIVNFKRLRGRTFLVPIHTAAYDTNGTFTTGAEGQLDDFAETMMSNNVLGVWHRPTTPGGSDGTSGGVVAFSRRDRVAFLSSRRD